MSKLMDRTYSQVYAQNFFIYLDLYIGDKSEVLDVDDPDEEKYPLFSKADRYEVELQPGDILFIPCKKLASWVGIRGTTAYSRQQHWFQCHIRDHSV